MESAVYERVWENAAYRQSAPGESLALLFIEKANPYGRVIDFGCGTGRGAALINAVSGAEVLALDFAGNCLDDEVKAQPGIKFKQHDLRKTLDEETAPFGYCTDVLEHIAPEDVDCVLVNVLTAARRVFLAISTVPDHFGPILAGEPLHLTVEPHSWWKDKLEKLGARIDWQEDAGESARFLCSIYANGDDYSKVTGLNVTEDRIRENISKNLRMGLNQVSPHKPQKKKIHVLAGGPSLCDHEEEIVRLGKKGALFVTVNGTHQWLIDRGIRPAANFIVDAREFNERFIGQIVPTCQYIFSSQAAHEAVSKVPKGQAWLYHSGDTGVVKECFDEYCREIGRDFEWFPVHGGSTVVSRTLVVLAMLGFRNIEVFGWDSCLVDDKHHAYEQSENDSAHVVTIDVGGREFRCHPWMVVQANEVPKIIRYILGPIDGFNLNVRGNGLIAHMINHAAKLAGKVH